MQTLGTARAITKSLTPSLVQQLAFPFWGNGVGQHRDTSTAPYRCFIWARSHQLELFSRLSKCILQTLLENSPCSFTNDYFGPASMWQCVVFEEESGRLQVQRMNTCCTLSAFPTRALLLIQWKECRELFINHAGFSRIDKVSSITTSQQRPTLIRAVPSELLCFYLLR